MNETPIPPSQDLPPEELGVTGVVVADKMRGDDPEDTRLLGGMLQTAKDYLFSFDWCSGVTKAYFGDGVGGVVAVFLMRIIPARKGIDEWLWVIVGDIPPAYLVTEGIRDPHEALAAYIEHRKEWVSFASQSKTPPKKIMPVDSVPPTAEWASKLDVRLETLKAHILPWFGKK